jgi:hypothetical protein
VTAASPENPGVSDSRLVEIAFRLERLAIQTFGRRQLVAAGAGQHRHAARNRCGSQRRLPAIA